MVERQIDQVARDMAQAAIAEIRQHAAVCLESERRRQVQLDSMQKSFEGWMRQIKEAFDAQQQDLSIRHSNSISTLGNNMGVLDNRMTEQDKKIASVEKKQTSTIQRFLVWGIGMAVTAVGAESLFILTHHFT